MSAYTRKRGGSKGDSSHASLQREDETTIADLARYGQKLQTATPVKQKRPPIAEVSNHGGEEEDDNDEEEHSNVDDDTDKENEELEDDEEEHDSARGKPGQCQKWLRVKKGETPKQCPRFPRHGNRLCSKHSRNDTLQSDTTRCDICGRIHGSSQRQVEQHLKTQQHLLAVMNHQEKERNKKRKRESKETVEKEEDDAEDSEQQQIKTIKNLKTKKVKKMDEQESVPSDIAAYLAKLIRQAIKDELKPNESSQTIQENQQQQRSQRKNTLSRSSSRFDNYYGQDDEEDERTENHEDDELQLPMRHGRENVTSNSNTSTTEEAPIVYGNLADHSQRYKDPLTNMFLN